MATRRNLPVVGVEHHRSSYNSRQVSAERWGAMPMDMLYAICERLEYRDVGVIWYVHPRWQHYLSVLGLLPQTLTLPGTAVPLPVEYLSLLRLSPPEPTDNPAFFLLLVKRSLRSRVFRRVNPCTGQDLITHLPKPIMLSRYQAQELASVYLVGDYPAGVIQSHTREFLMIIGGGGGIKAVYLCNRHTRWHDLISDVDIVRVISHRGRAFCEEATGGVVIIDEWLRVVRLPNPYYKRHPSPPTSIVVESGGQLLWVSPILEGPARYVTFSLDEEEANPRWVRLKVLSHLTTNVAIIFHRIVVCISGLQEARTSRGMVVLVTEPNEFVLSRDTYLLLSKWVYLVCPDPAWLKPHEEEPQLRRSSRLRLRNIAAAQESMH